MPTKQIEMALKTAEHDIADILKRIGKIETLIEKNPEAAHFSKLVKTLQENLQSSHKALEEEVEVNDNHYNALHYLLRILGLEYHGMFEYHSHSEAIEEPELAKKLNRFLHEEVKHANEVVKTIRKLGGVPRVSIEGSQSERKISVGELLQEHEEAERASIELLDEAMQAVTDPEYSYLFGKLKLDEQEHLKLVKELQKEYEESELMVSIRPHFTDAPSKDEERPWVDG